MMKSKKIGVIFLIVISSFLFSLDKINAWISYDKYVVFDYSQFKENNPNFNSIKDNQYIAKIYDDFINKLPNDYGYILKTRVPYTSQNSIENVLAYELYIFQKKYTYSFRNYYRSGYSADFRLNFTNNSDSTIYYKKFDLSSNYGTTLYDDELVAQFENFLISPNWSSATNDNNMGYSSLYGWSLFYGQLNYGDLPKTFNYLPYIVSSNMECTMFSHSYGYDVHVIDFDGKEVVYTSNDVIETTLENLLESANNNVEVNVPNNAEYIGTFNDKDFMLLIQNDFCQYANEENYIDYKVKISAKNAFNSDSSRSIYFQSMYADNNKFGKFIDDSINSMTGNSSIVFIDENTLEVNIRLSIDDVEFACNTMPTSRLFKFDLGQLIDELKTENFEIEIYSSAKGNKYTILPYEFYEKDIYFTSKVLYDSSVLFYLEPTNVTETTDNTIYLKNNVDYGVWNYQNSTSKRDKYFDLSMKYGLYTYKIEFDTKNNKITGFKTIDDNLIFLDSAYTLKVHHPQSDFIIGDLIIQDNTEEVEIIKDSYENINDLLDTFNNYLTQIKKPIAPIMGLIGDLFNSMNSHIKGALISLLVILLLCALIKQIFKS